MQRMLYYPLIWTSGLFHTYEEEKVYLCLRDPPHDQGLSVTAWKYLVQAHNTNKDV